MAKKDKDKDKKAGKKAKKKDAGKKTKGKLVSPLAPAAFPALPVIEGAEFSAAAAGVR